MSGERDKAPVAHLVFTFSSPAAQLRSEQTIDQLLSVAQDLGTLILQHSNRILSGRDSFSTITPISLSILLCSSRFFPGIVVMERAVW